MTCPYYNIDTLANISALFVHNAHAVKCLKYVIATTAVLTLVKFFCSIPDYEVDLSNLIQFKFECGTAQLRLQLFFLFSCYRRYCH